MSREHHSEAWEEINPPSYFNPPKKKKKQKRVSKEEAKQKFAAIHTAIDIENHMRALRE